MNSYSPAKLFMGCRLCTTVLALPALLNPALPDYNALEVKDRRINDSRNFNERHRARNLEPLTPGEDVWITDAQVQGTVVSPHNTPRSYLVQVPQGTLTTNRHHLVLLQTAGGVVDAEEPVGEDSTTPEPAPPETTSRSSEDHTAVSVRTRSGREVGKPQT